MCGPRLARDKFWRIVESSKDFQMADQRALSTKSLVSNNNTRLSLFFLSNNPQSGWPWNRSTKNSTNLFTRRLFYIGHLLVQLLIAFTHTNRAIVPKNGNYGLYRKEAVSIEAPRVNAKQTQSIHPFGRRKPNQDIVGKCLLSLTTTQVNIPWSSQQVPHFTAPLRSLAFWHHP